ncbi:hypothetical protein NQ315_014105 [Exocentrus adspersus]|uniref:RNase H type-1 domain-containing protein n=1 Tax=Exocentrus adspersus TaxID=1586481 RepID=A0AAV8VVN3_9CUCU|nr:hypothetical protein NQ315_014105 [Exocentrus adspersus]
MVFKRDDAEVFAILMVEQREDVKNCTEERIFICSDSQAALRAISSPRTRSSMLVQECGDALESLDRQKEVGLVWSRDIWEFQGTRGLINWHVSGQGNLLRGRNQSLGSREEVSMGPSVNGHIEDEE